MSQFSDLLHFGVSENNAFPMLHDLLTHKASGRRILIALGKQEQDKGFDYLVDLWCSSPKVRETFLCVVAGKVNYNSAQKAQLFVQQGGLLIDRHISNGELIYLYRRADIISEPTHPLTIRLPGYLDALSNLEFRLQYEDSYLEKLKDSPSSNPRCAIWKHRYCRGRHLGMETHSK